METNIILAGVGGQGILSISYVIDMTALAMGLAFKQSEVHGMSQRGGAVQSHLRISDRDIASDLVPKGKGTLLLSVEPLESLRYLEYLSPAGAVVTSVDPYINIADYPNIDSLLNEISKLPQHTLVYAEQLAKEAGSARAQNMVLLGAALPFLGLNVDPMESNIREAFARKGERTQEINIAAFRYGKNAGQAYRACLAAGIHSQETRALVKRLSQGLLHDDAIPLWKKTFAAKSGSRVMTALLADRHEKFSGDARLPSLLFNAINASQDISTEQLTSILFE